MKKGIGAIGKMNGARLFAAALLALAFGLGASPTLAQGTPAVTVSDQAVQESTVTVAGVTAAQDGWIVIHESRPDGTVLAPDSIGQGAVKAGANTDVKVTLQKQVEVGAKLWAMLHIDAGTLGTYEFPGADTPVSIDGAVVMQPFMITAAQPQPTTEPTAQPTTEPTAEPTAAPEPPAAVEDSVTVADQVISGNTVVIARVSSSRDGWLVIHESRPDGTVLAPDSIAQAPVKAGVTENLSIPLGIEITSSARLWAMLHVDAGQAGVYEFPGPDAPVTVGGQVVMQPFEATWEGAVTGPAPAPGMPRTGAGFGPEFFVAAALAATALFGGGLAARRKAARVRK